MTKTGKILACFLMVLLTAWQVLAAPPKIAAFADRKEMGQGDTIAVTVQVSSDDSVEVNEPQIPDMNDFEVLNSWTSTSTSSRLVQGKNGMEFQTQRLYEFHYMLAPKRQGNLNVPAFDVSVDGATQKTVPFTIRVSGEGSGANRVPNRPGMGAGGGGTVSPDDAIDEAEAMFQQLLRQRGGAVPKGQVVPKNANEAFFIHVDLDKTEVYEGEQITANWYIFSRGNILSLDRLKFPDLKGFWKEIIEEVPALNFTQEILNGVAYRKALLASHALFPIKPGTSYVDEYKVKATVQLPTSPFGSFGFGQPYTYNRSSDKVKITVKPLPTEGRPQDFSGAVGQFEVQSSVDHNDVPINQPLALKIRFEGEGNAKLIELPPLPLPVGLETYETKSDAKFFKNGRSFKEFEVLIIPREPGDVQIPAISVSLFDPKTAKYYTKKTEPIALKVSGSKSEAATAATTKTEPGAPKKPSEPQIPGIMTSYSSSKSVATWPFLGVMSLMTLGALAWKGRRELGRKEKRETIRDLLRTRMRKVQKSLKAGEWREASVQMTNVIYAVLGEISGEGGASRELKILLEKAPPSLRRELGEELSQTLDFFQFLSFAPEDAIGVKKETSELEVQVRKAEKLLSRSIEHVDAHSNE